MGDLLVIGALAALVALLVLELVSVVRGWWSRRRARTALDHATTAFLTRQPQCNCEPCRTWRRVWGQG